MAVMKCGPDCRLDTNLLALAVAIITSTIATTLNSLVASYFPTKDAYFIHQQTSCQGNVGCMQAWCTVESQWIGNQNCYTSSDLSVYGYDPQYNKDHLTSFPSDDTSEAMAYSALAMLLLLGVMQLLVVCSNCVDRHGNITIESLRPKGKFWAGEITCGCVSWMVWMVAVLVTAIGAAKASRDWGLYNLTKATFVSAAVFSAVSGLFFLTYDLWSRPVVGDDMERMERPAPPVKSNKGAPLASGFGSPGSASPSAVNSSEFDSREFKQNSPSGSTAQPIHQAAPQIVVNISPAMFAQPGPSGGMSNDGKQVAYKVQGPRLSNTQPRRPSNPPESYERDSLAGSSEPLPLGYSFTQDSIPPPAKVSMKLPAHDDSLQQSSQRRSSNPSVLQDFAADSIGDGISYPQSEDPAWYPNIRQSMKADVSLTAGSIDGMSKGGGDANGHGRTGSQTSLRTGTLAYYTFEELDVATDHFSKGNILGEGGFGKVYKGVMLDGTLVAVKKLHQRTGAAAKTAQGLREFQAEIDIISRVHHRNLVRLVGFCSTDDEQLLVYEHMSEGSLAPHISAKYDKPPLTWPIRIKIAIGAARGLCYLHEDCDPKIIHRDIKASNILLDSNFNAKVADFGLARLLSSEFTHVTTRVMGTFGYLAPEYALSGQLTEKSDVYSFGVVLLELVTGKKAIDTTELSGSPQSLVEWSWQQLRDGREPVDLADVRLKGQFNLEELKRVWATALLCVHHISSKRPTMEEVVQMLKGEQTPMAVNPVSEDEIMESLHQQAYTKRRSSSGSATKASLKTPSPGPLSAITEAPTAEKESLAHTVDLTDMTIRPPPPPPFLQAEGNTDWRKVDVANMDPDVANTAKPEPETVMVPERFEEGR